MPKSVLIAGCGFVGLPLARDFAVSGWETYAIVASEASMAKLHGESFRAYALDIRDKANFRNLARRNFDVVIHCASSGRGGAADYESVFLVRCTQPDGQFAVRPLHLLPVLPPCTAKSTASGWMRSRPRIRCGETG